MKPFVGTFIETEGNFYCQEVNAWCYKVGEKWVIGSDLGGLNYKLYRNDLIRG